jgi:signal transduction histidine kinase
MATTVAFVLSESEVQRRKASLELTAEDEQRLRDAHPLIHAHAPAIIDRFYEYLLAHEHTRRMLSAPGLVDRLKTLQARYFAELTSGQYDVAYFQKRLAVGLTHERVGLAPEWYMGAYHRYLEIVSDVLSRALAGQLELYLRTMTSLTKVIFLDMNLALETYFLTAQARLAEKNAAIEATNAELVRLHAAKQQLTDMIVHDLQNPLAGLNAFLQVLKADPGRLSETQRDALDEALRRSDDLSQMIMNVLHLSRAEAGKLDTYVESVDLAALTREVASAFALVAGHRGCRLAVEGPATLVHPTDRQLVQRILGNLLRNVFQHTPRGTSVTVTAEAAPDGPRVRVVDDGPGIPVHLQPLMFERFGATALRAAGLRVDSGLGLAFCQTAAKALGATLALESDGRQGSAFTLSFRTTPRA